MAIKHGPVIQGRISGSGAELAGFTAVPAGTALHRHGVAEPSGRGWRASKPESFPAWCSNAARAREHALQREPAILDSLGVALVKARIVGNLAAIGAKSTIPPSLMTPR